jgi:hypothetical protein
MQTYTAIALLSLMGITLSATAARASELSVERLVTATTQYMLLAQTQPTSDLRPERGSGR